MDRNPTESPATAPPIFILSSPRSGSTLTRVLFDTHSQVCSPGELYLGKLSQSLCHTLAATLGPTHPELAPRELGALVCSEARRHIDDILADYLRAKGKGIWCEKTAGYLQHIEVLEQVFPDARFVCLYRNCMDVVNSCLSVWKFGFMEDLAPWVAKRPESLVGAMIDSWVDKTRRLLAFETRRPQQCFRLKYESMVTAPEETLSELFTFLGLPWEPEILTAAFQIPHDPDQADQKVRFTKQVESKFIGRGSEIPLRDIQPADLPPMNRLLRQLGYPEVGPDWNTAPSPYLPSGATQSPAAVESPGTTTASTHSVASIFENHIPARLDENAEALAATKAVFQFQVVGESAEVWTVDLRGEAPKIVRGSGDADCTMTVDSAVLADIVRGDLNPVAAFSEGKVKIVGNFELAYKMNLLL